nr:transposase [Belnapia moabensis]
MKQPWCLASSTDLPPADLIKLYARRWNIECGFRDAKDPHFGMGMGMGEIHLSSPACRDRLWLIAAFSIVSGRWMVLPAGSVDDDALIHAPNSGDGGW